MKNFNKMIFAASAFSAVFALSPVNVSANSWNESHYTDSEELRKFLSEAEPSRIINDNCKVIPINYLGTDENGKAMYNDHKTPIEIDVFLGYDENGYEIGGLANEELVWFDENGIPEIIYTDYLGATEEGLGIFKTTDITTGKDMIVIDEKHDDNNCILAKFGDTNTDGQIDIRDVTALKQDIVKSVDSL